MLIFILFILFIIVIMILEMINNYQEQKLLKQLATFDKSIKVSDYQYQQYSKLIEHFIKLVLKDKNISYQQYQLSKGCIAFLGVNDMDEHFTVIHNVDLYRFPKNISQQVTVINHGKISEININQLKAFISDFN